MLFLGGEVRVVDGYVFVCNESVPDTARARKILAAVDHALDHSGHRAVLFDTREMPGPSEEVNAVLRAWVDAAKYHDKVALVVKSDLKLIASNMRALAVKVQLRSFHDLREAERWLRAPVPVARTITEPMEIARPGAQPRPPAADKSGGKQPDASRKPSDETQPRFVWRSALLRQYLGDG